MARNDDKSDEKATEARKVLFVSSVSKDGFRRINRWFGPDEVRVEVTAEEAAALASVPGQLRVYTPESKNQLEAMAQGRPLPPAQARPAAPPPKPAAPPARDG